MKKLYLDRTQLTSCTAVFVSDAQVIDAGATVNAMPVKDKDKEYERFAREYGIHFLFEDNIPAVDFYTIPQFDIFAVDGKGSFLGSVGEGFEPGNRAPICLVDKNRRCYLVASNFREFISCAAYWAENLRPFHDIVFYPSKSAAKKELEFIDIDELNAMRNEVYDGIEKSDHT